MADEIWYIFLDWRPVSVAPMNPKILRYIPHLCIGSESFLAVDVYMRNDGFFLFSVKANRRVLPWRAVMAARGLSHKIKERHLKHVHGFHPERMKSRPILVKSTDELGNPIRTRWQARAYINENSKSTQKLVNLKAWQIEDHQNNHFGALELMKMHIGELPERDQRVFTDEMRPFFVRKKATNLTANITYSVIVVIIICLFCGLMLPETITKLIQQPILSFLFLSSTILAVFFLYRRMIGNVNLVKRMIRSKGYIERLQIAVKIISEYIRSDSRLVEHPISASISQLIEYEKEKGNKYKLELAVFVSFLILAAAFYNVFIK